MSKLISLLMVVGLTALGIAGDFFMKLAGKGPRFVEWKWFIIGAIVWSLTIPGWFFILKYMKLATAGAIVSVVVVVALTLIGTFYFKEALNAYEIIGIVAAMIALGLLARFA